jgi:tetratricopeptide (TPR) repeat protein
MIIWIRNRKGWVAVIFFALALIFGLSFIIGGVGTGSNASISDIFNNGGASNSNTSTSPTGDLSISELQKIVKAKPNNAQAWSDLADAYSSASRPSDEAAAWKHVVLLKPTSMNSLQRLALAQGQVATNQSSAAQQLQQRAYSSSPASDTTFSGGTLGSLSEDSVTQAQAAAQSVAQTRLLKQASTAAAKANVWWKLSSGTYAKLVKLPAFAKNDLAASVWLNYGSASQSANDLKSALVAYNAFLKIAPDDVNAAQVRKIVKQIKASEASTSTTSTTP